MKRTSFSPEEPRAPKPISLMRPRTQTSSISRPSRRPGIALHINLLQSFLHIVKQLGSPMDVVRSDVLLSFEVLSSTKRHVVRQFAWVSAVSARAGALKPEQTFVLAEVGDCGHVGEGVHRFDGLYLDLALEPYVQCKKEYLPAPPDEPPVGRLRMFVSDSWAFHLLSVFDDHPGLFAGQVVINKLQFQDCTPRRVRVVGFDANFQRVLVSADGFLEGLQHDSDVHEAADPMLDGAGDDAGPSAGSGMDFLALLDDTDTGPTPAPAKRRKKSQTVSQGLDVPPAPENASLFALFRRFRHELCGGFGHEFVFLQWWD